MTWTGGLDESTLSDLMLWLFNKEALLPNAGPILRITSLLSLWEVSSGSRADRWAGRNPNLRYIPWSFERRSRKLRFRENVSTEQS